MKRGVALNATASFFLKTDEGVMWIISNNNNVIHERRELKVPMGRENIAEGGK